MIKITKEEWQSWRNSNHKYYYLYSLYYSIMDRCYNPKSPKYNDYGGRGITFYWKDNLLEFAEYILNILGERLEGLTIDRINNDKGYDPGNLRWATMHEQNLNQRLCPGIGRNNNIPYISLGRNGNFCVQIYELGKGRNAKTIFCHSFPTKQEAIEARNKFFKETNDPRLSSC